MVKYLHFLFMVSKIYNYIWSIIIFINIYNNYIFFVNNLKNVLMHFNPKLITTIYNDLDPNPVYLNNDNCILSLSLQTSCLLKLNI